MKIERVVYELWEILGVLCVLTSHFITGVWGKVFLWYGVYNIVIALIHQEIEYIERKKRQ